MLCVLALSVEPRLELLCHGGVNLLVMRVKSAVARLNMSPRPM